MSALDVKKHGGLDRSLRLSCRALLSVFASNEGGHDIQGGGGRHTTLLPSLDGALGDAASGRELLSGKSGLLTDRLDSGAVVHNGPVIREDDGLAVGATGVIVSNSHGSVLGEGEAASEVDQVVADAVNLDDRGGLAIARLGVAEVLLDGAHGWLAIGADRRKVAGEAVADGGHGLGGSGHFCFGLVRGLIASTPARYARLRNESTPFYAKVRIFSMGRFRSTQRQKCWRRASGIRL